MSDVEQLIAEAEAYAAEGALEAEHRAMVDDVDRQLRVSVTGLHAAALKAQDALSELYTIARAHRIVQTCAAARLARVSPDRYREGAGFTLRGVQWEPVDPDGILERTLAYVRLEADGAPAPGPVPPAVFDDGHNDPQ